MGRHLKYTKRKLADGQYEWVETLKQSVKEFPPTPGTKILVGSIFANDSKDQQQWLDLQLKYLRATTPSFEHVVLLYNQKTQYFNDRTKVLKAKVECRGKIFPALGILKVEASSLGCVEELEESF